MRILARLLRLLTHDAAAILRDSLSEHLSIVGCHSDAFSARMDCCRQMRSQRGEFSASSDSIVHAWTPGAALGRAMRLWPAVLLLWASQTEGTPLLSAANGSVLLSTSNGRDLVLDAAAGAIPKPSDPPRPVAPSDRTPLSPRGTLSETCRPTVTLST